MPLILLGTQLVPMNVLIKTGGSHVKWQLPGEVGPFLIIGERK